MLLAGKVVQRDVDGRQGVNAEPAPAGPEHALIHALPVGRQLDRLRPDQHLGHVAGPEMRGRHLEEALHHLRRRVRLADAAAAIRVEDAHDDRLCRSVEIVGGLHRRRERDHFEPFDLRHLRRLRIVRNTGPLSELS
jgi:hypothetical protein